MARSRPSIRKAIPGCISRRVLALGSLLCPQVYGLRFVSPARMLNLPFAASSTILRAYVPSVAARDSNARSYRQASSFYMTGKRRISSGGLWTRYATRSDPGYSDRSEKVRNNPLRVLTSAYDPPTIASQCTKMMSNISATIVHHSQGYFSSSIDSLLFNEGPLGD